MQYHSISNYTSVLSSLIFDAEDFSPVAYYDSASPKRPSIGYGLNLTVSSVRDKVFSTLGISVQLQSQLLVVINAPFSTKLLASEHSFLSADVDLDSDDNLRLALRFANNDSDFLGIWGQS